MSTLRNALCVAADKFDENAQMCADGRAAFDALDEAGKEAYFDRGGTPGRVRLNPNPRFYDQMRDQFEKQARETRALLATFDGGAVEIRVVSTY